MMWENNIFLILLLAFSISGCGYRNKPNKKTVERPIIYDAWDARYYEMESRRLVPCTMAGKWVELGER